MISFEQTYLIFYFLEYLHLFLDDNVDEEANNFQGCVASGCCLDFVWFFASFSLALLVSVAYNKSVYMKSQSSYRANPAPG